MSKLKYRSNMTLSCTTKTWHALIQGILQLKNDVEDQSKASVETGMCPENKEALKSIHFFMFSTLIVQTEHYFHVICYDGGLNVNIFYPCVVLLVLVHQCHSAFWLAPKNT